MPATIGSKQNSDRALIPAVEAVQVPVPVALPGSLEAMQLCRLHAQLSLRQSCHGQNTLLSLLSVSLQDCQIPFYPGDYGRILYEGGDSPCKNPGAYWPIWIAMPF